MTIAMPFLKRSKYLPYAASQMFDLVNDVSQYPRFLPWCVGATVLSADEAAMQASLDFAKGIWRKSFTTRNRFVRDERIEMQLVDGPFAHLSGEWTFANIAGLGCKTDLNLHFEFKNALTQFTLGALVKTTADQVVDAFTQRAHALYAK